jgi:hypothetical protein
MIEHRQDGIIFKASVDSSSSSDEDGRQSQSRTSVTMRADVPSLQFTMRSGHPLSRQGASVITFHLTQLPLEFLGERTISGSQATRFGLGRGIENLILQKVGRVAIDTKATAAEVTTIMEKEAQHVGIPLFEREAGHCTTNIGSLFSHYSSSHDRGGQHSSDFKSSLFLLESHEGVTMVLQKTSSSSNSWGDSPEEKSNIEPPDGQIAKHFEAFLPSGKSLTELLCCMEIPKQFTAQWNEFCSLVRQYDYYERGTVPPESD